MKKYNIFLCLAIPGLLLAVSSCQTVQGMGRDLGNFGKSLVSPKQKKPDQSAAPAAQAFAASGQKISVAGKDAKKKVPPSPAGRSKDNKAPDSTREKKRTAPLSQMKDRMLQKEMFDADERETSDGVSLEKFSEESELQAVPERVEPLPGAMEVDVNGDGVPEARYRQR